MEDPTRFEPAPLVEAGDWVLVSVTSLHYRHKFAPCKWEGPFPVLHVPNHFQVVYDLGEGQERTAHINHVKKYTPQGGRPPLWPRARLPLVPLTSPPVPAAGWGLLACNQAAPPAPAPDTHIDADEEELPEAPVPITMPDDDNDERPAGVSDEAACTHTEPEEEEDTPTMPQGDEDGCPEEPSGVLPSAEAGGERSSAATPSPLPTPTTTPPEDPGVHLQLGRPIAPSPIPDATPSSGDSS